MRAVPPDKIDGQVRLIKRLVTVRFHQPAVVGVVLRAGWIVMAAIETLERLEPVAPPTRWNEPGNAVAIHVPLPYVVSGVAGCGEHIGDGMLARRQHQMVEGHPVLVRIPSGQDA